ncbi:uncharacterized protein LOC127755729 [Oryza glaberrima]|uniref:uncharacterized protein LOC127755729 n=1 Tax=Oryza glaberrima TaxID=4538 RepID=UPI00224C5AE6|nr:uncharacterized protein LOC127755729 [Oryza glaberrima]
MDRDWMSEPRTSASYKDGVAHFLSIAFRDVPDDAKVLCRCVNCRNRITQNYDRVKTHLRCAGILQSYTKWIHHGEKYDAPSLVFAPVSGNPRNIPISSAHKSNVVEVGDGRSDNMEGLLNAAFGREDSFESISSASIDDDGIYFESSYAEPNMVEDENNTFGDGHNGGEQDMFTRLLKDAKTKLYHGCDKFSRQIYRRIVMKQKKIIRGLGLGYQKIHACPKDCVLFRGDKDNQESCDVCGSSRWITDKNGYPVESKGKKKPAKVLRYFPLIPRIQRLFSTEQTSGEMRWHEEGRTKDGLLRHPADGEAWNDLNTRYPGFSADARNVRLGLASDGFNPFRNMSSKHSTWPVMLIPYNLPPWICMKQTSLILSMIIPGPHSPGNDIDVYLEPLVDELLQLWQGVETYDASARKKFSLRATLLWTLNDFPAFAYLYGWSTGGKYACPSCATLTKSFRLKKGGKFCYMGHRRWLPPDHKYRELGSQFDGTEEKEIAPKTLNGTSVLEMLQGRVFVFGKKVSIAKMSKRKRQAKKNTNDKGSNRKLKGKRKTCKEKSRDNPSKSKKKPEDWLKKRSIFFKLEYWECNKLRHNLDVMHIEKNVCDNLIGTLLDISSKTKDDLNARLDLVNIGIRPELHPTIDDKGKQILPPAPFTMSREKKEILCSVIQNIKTPDGYASNISRSFVRIKALVQNRAYPEGSIAEGYIADECLTYCSRFSDETTRFTRPPRNLEPSDNTKDLYMFESAGEPIGKAITVARFDNQFLVQAHRYVLRHCDELEDFRKEFLDEEKRKLPHTTSLTQSVIDRLINRSFADWLEQKVLENGAEIDEKTRALAAKPNKTVVRYSGYIINGFRLSDIVELSYRNYKVVLFRCDWYDVHHRAGMKNDEFWFSLVNFSRKIHTGQKLDDDPFVFSSQVEQVFYSEDPKTEGWHVVTRFRPRDLFDMGVEQPSDEAE